MSQFATEFPIKRLGGRSAFLAQLFGWLRGINDSKLVAGRDEHDLGVELDQDAAFLYSLEGEELSVREIVANGEFEAIGFRHDIPDAEGRVWRTEATVTRSSPSSPSDLFRLRAQCIAQDPQARIETPKKTYLIKSILRDGWGAKDGKIDVVDQPIWLSDDDPSLKIAQEITTGQASVHLPVVYVSAFDSSRWLLDKKDIDRIANLLGGIAHVVVEPNRAFSFKLRDVTYGANAYGGTVGICIPNGGVRRRLFLGEKHQTPAALASAITVIATELRSLMPIRGWDWRNCFNAHFQRKEPQSVRELALRRKRKRKVAKNSNYIGLTTRFLVRRSPT